MSKKVHYVYWHTDLARNGKITKIGENILTRKPDTMSKKVCE